MLIFALMRTLALALVWMFLFSCSADEHKCAFVPDTSSLSVNLHFEPLEDSLPAITTKADLVRFMTAHPDTRDLFFNRGAYPSDSVFINRLFSRFSNAHIDTLLMETHRFFGDGTALREQFTQAYSNL